MKPRLHWIPQSRLSRHALFRSDTQADAAIRSWLLDESSLTARLRGACRNTNAHSTSQGGGFAVEVLRQRRERARLDESRALGIAANQACLIREVLLHCDVQPWVYARSVIPVSSLRGRARRLAHLKNKPLGAYLFAQPDLIRSEIEVVALNDAEALNRRAELRGPVWGRRSVFRVHANPLLVSEFFLPELFDHST